MRNTQKSMVHRIVSCARLKAVHMGCTGSVAATVPLGLIHRSRCLLPTGTRDGSIAQGTYGSSVRQREPTATGVVAGGATEDNVEKEARATEAKVAEMEREWRAMRDAGSGRPCPADYDSKKFAVFVEQAANNKTDYADRIVDLLQLVIGGQTLGYHITMKMYRMGRTNDDEGQRRMEQRTFASWERERMAQEADKVIEGRRMVHEWWEKDVIAPATRLRPLEALVREFRLTNLTHHHNYGTDEKPLVMLGSDRQRCVDAFVNDVQRAKSSPLSSAKEDWPIHYVVAAPRQGKSLLLDEIGRRVKDECAMDVVTITFNSHTALDCTESLYKSEMPTVQSEFWGRVLFELYRMVVKASQPSEYPMTFSSFVRRPFFHAIDWDTVRTIAEQLELRELLVVADELSALTDRMMTDVPDHRRQLAMTGITTMYAANWRLVCSGFKAIDAERMSSWSCGRPLSLIALPPLSNATRPEFDGMRAAIAEPHPEGALPPPSRLLYEVIKNVPGYLGWWVEMLDYRWEIKTLRNYTLRNYRPPVVGFVSCRARDDPRLFSGYWRAVANGDKASPAFGQLERIGALLRTTDSRFPGFLSPLLFAHCDINCYVAERIVIASVTDALAVERWTAAAKGNALVMVLEAALVLRAAYTNDRDSARSVTLGQLIGWVCGREDVPAAAVDSAPAESDVISFPAFDGRAEGLIGVVRAVNVFPATRVAKRHRRGQSARKTLEAEWRQQNEAALMAPNVSVIRSGTEFNPGCDRALLARSSSGDLVLFLFEVQYLGKDGGGDVETGAATDDGVEAISRKAMHALSACEQYLGDRIRLRRLCFVYCTTALDAVPANAYDLGHTLGDDTLGGVMERLRLGGCSSSLHVVGTEEAWRSLLMESLYLVVPTLPPESTA